MARAVAAGLAAVVGLFAAEASVRSVSVDDGGQLHLVLDSGKEVLPQKIEGQVAFDAALIAEDRRTVGWLVMYADPDGANRGPIAGKLAIYRAGRVLRTFDMEPVGWDWQFRDGGKRVAYSVGPTHGGADECVLRDVESGRIVARWLPKSGGDPPEWAADLRY